MKFFIDDREIKTINTGAIIEGSLNLVSRCANFSYVFDDKNLEFENYKAKLGSKVLIKNDSNKNIFKGKITSINYQSESKIIQITAHDFLYELVNQKVIGRYKGDFLNIISKAISSNNFIKSVKKFLDDEINIVSFGDLSSYDVIKLAATKLFGDEFKIYLDGDSNIEVLIPSVSSSKGDFRIGENIISSNFNSSSSGNLSTIVSLGNDNIVSGSLIRVIEPKNGFFGYFIVEKDKHIYDFVHTMELQIKERTFN